MCGATQRAGHRQRSGAAARRQPRATASMAIPSVPRRTRRILSPRSSASSSAVIDGHRRSGSNARPRAIASVNQRGARRGPVGVRCRRHGSRRSAARTAAEPSGTGEHRAAPQTARRRSRTGRPRGPRVGEQLLGRHVRRRPGDGCPLAVTCRLVGDPHGAGEAACPVVEIAREAEVGDPSARHRRRPSRCRA